MSVLKFSSVRRLSSSRFFFASVNRHAGEFRYSRNLRSTDLIAARMPSCLAFGPNSIRRCLMIRTPVSIRTYLD